MNIKPKRASYLERSEHGKQGKRQFSLRFRKFGRKVKITYMQTTKKTGG